MVAWAVLGSTTRGATTQGWMEGREAMRRWVVVGAMLDRLFNQCTYQHRHIHGHVKLLPGWDCAQPENWRK